MSKATEQTPDETDPWYGSALYRDWYNSVVRSPPNDMVIVVTASSRTPVSGSGKTSVGVNLAEKTDLADGFDAEIQSSLDAESIAYEMLPEIPSRSAIIWDEAQGAPGTTGLDSRRAMKDSNIDAVNAILANRDKRLTIIIIAQQFNTLDPRIYPVVDAWLLIRKEPSHPGGPQGTYHQVYTEDYNLANPKVRTPAIEDFSWLKVPHSNENYQILERKKQAAKQHGGGEEEKRELPDAEQLELAKEFHNSGVPWRKVGEKSDLLEYSGEYYRQQLKDKENSDSSE